LELTSSGTACISTLIRREHSIENTRKKEKFAKVLLKKIIPQQKPPQAKKITVRNCLLA